MFKVEFKFLPRLSNTSGGVPDTAISKFCCRSDSIFNSWARDVE